MKVLSHEASATATFAGLNAKSALTEMPCRSRGRVQRATSTARATFAMVG